MKKALLFFILTLFTNSFADIIKSEKVVIYSDNNCKSEDDYNCYNFLYSYDKSGIDFIDKVLLSSLTSENNQTIESIKNEIAKLVAEEKELMKESHTGASSVVETKFLNQKNNLVQYVSATESYSAGAAHGIAGNFYYIFDLEEQKRLVLKDILIKGKEKSLIAVLEKSLKKSEVPTFDAHPFNEDLYETVNNFYFTNKGIIFDFPPYQIAPYAAGEIVIELDKKELKGIIKDKYLQ